jgi:hypothetical protein
VRKETLRIVHAVVVRGTRYMPAYSLPVHIQADHEGPHHHHPVSANAANGGGKVPGFGEIELLAYLRQAFGRGRLKADEHAGTPGSGRERKKFLIIREVDGGLCHPLLV